ncbi:MAG: 4-(cytidine 5'-diphospho)-2-C-methyl-D-erythritol kinase [Clostridia bacterium]|nr:4-(cytidine 5'-diphospho)-2-C-methyl-D-erythritol kinase [Clostridia bacterium]
MIIRAYAKINWSLDTVGLREDGYHLLDMVMQSVSLHDTLTIEPAAALSLHTEGPVRTPAGPDNLALRAAEALRRHAGINAGADIRLRKRIPSGAGLGGGSSDAAAVLRGLNTLWGLAYPLDTLCDIGLQLGADIPYCLHGTPCRVQGIGEIITPLPLSRVYHLVILQPCRGLSTRQVFTALGEASALRRPDTAGVIAALKAGALTALPTVMGNTLQEISLPLRPQIRQAITALREHGARAAQMTGSGSAVFGVFSSPNAARTAWEALRKKYRSCHLAQTLTAIDPV